MQWLKNLIKMNLRKKLIIYFILIVIIPIIFYIVFFNILGVYLNNSDTITQVDTVIAEFENEIKSNIEVVNNKQAFAESLQPILSKYQGELQIISPENDMIIFDSASESETELDYTNLNISSNLNADYFTYLTEIETAQGSYIYSLIFNRNTMFESVQGTVMRYIILGVAISIILLGFLVYYFSRIISRQILIPLEELNEATKNIAKGNLNYEIDYCGDNELGNFCEAFETMRLKLKKSLEKQSLYENNRKELIASISHDLKTPITSIQGYVEGLIDGIPQDEEAFNKYLQIIKDKAVRLNHLIDDLFHFSKLELDKLNIETRKYSSQSVFNQILKHYVLEFEGIDQELIIKRPIPDVKIKVDKRRIEQVVDNIIKNAREFIKEDGKVEISFDVDQKYFTVNITDNGVGIKKQDKNNIFNKFYRGEKSRSRKFGGTGLGLAICREIIKAHQGDIGVESIRGQGSTFYFKLPIVN